MAMTSPLDRVTAIVLRYMRPPVFVLVAVYAIGVIGMALLPGQDAEGNPTRMSLFHAFYFFTYTATTTGFGEIPNTFTNEQRLWAIFCLYLGVIAWLYAIGSIIQLAQNPHFVRAMAERRFARAVKGISEPFFIICGFGDTGSLLARGLSDNLVTAAVIDADAERVKALALRDYRVPTPGLWGDAGVPQHLVDAGVQRASCQGVVVLTGDEDTNLKIAVMSRSLNPEVPVICRCSSERHQSLLRSLEGIVVIDPFELFAQQLDTAITRPRLRTLEDWLVCARGVALDQQPKIPIGPWVLCGYGRMGRWIHSYLSEHGLPTVVIDPEVKDVTGEVRIITSHADPDTLQRVDIESAAGIVAGTRSDPENLAILLAARSLNPTIFSIVRQNHHENQLAFEGVGATHIMQPSLITARKILLTAIAPLAEDMVDMLREGDGAGTTEVINALSSAVGGHRPSLWGFRVDAQSSSAVADRISKGLNVSLGDLMRHPRDSDRRLECVALMLRRDKEKHVMPEDELELQPGDELVMCSSRADRALLEATLGNSYTLYQLVTGTEPPRGYLFRWLERRREDDQATA